MVRTADERRQQAKVLIVNDKVTRTNSLKARLLMASVTHITDICRYEDLIDLCKSAKIDPPGYALIIADYLYGDWGNLSTKEITFDIVLKLLEECGVTKAARIVILSAYPQPAREDKLIKARRYEVIDDINAAPSTIEAIVDKYI